MRTRRETITTATVLAAALAFAAAPAAWAAFPGAAGKIAFESDRSGNFEIWVMGADGSDPAILAGFFSSADRAPAWSPDGTKLAFQSNRTGDIEIWVVDADGANLTRLTFNAGPDIQPAWSPDGERLAFSRQVAGEYDVFTMRAADGGDVVNVTLGSGNDTLAAWSPDGTRVAYRSDRDFNGEIYVQPVASPGPAAAANLTGDPGDDDHPAWSPDGTRIAFTTDRDGDGSRVYTMFDDGTVPLAVPGTIGGDGEPAWSPDGGSIVHSRLTSGGAREIRAATLDDGTGSVLAPGLRTSRCPDWQALPMTEENLPPVANAGPDGGAACASAEGGPVALDGRASSDPDSTPGTNDDIVVFEWFLDFGLPSERLLSTGATAEVVLPAGAHTVTLRVTDADGASDTDETVWTVADSHPTTLQVSVSPASLWPPNHRLVAIHASVWATGGACSPAPAFVLESVTSSEPDDAEGDGDGSTTGDVDGVESGTADVDFALRAERSSSGPGRTYTVTYAIADGPAAGTTASATVVVPHSSDDDGATRATKPRNVRGQLRPR